MAGRRKISAHIFLAVGAFVMLFPFVWMVLGALKTPAEIASVPPKVFPGSVQLDNLRYVIDSGRFGTYFLNTLIIAVCVVVSTVVTSILAGFALAFYEFRGKMILIGISVALMMVPFEVLVIVNFETIVTWSLTDTLAAQILPFTTSIFSMLLVANAFRAVPANLHTAARVDGASNWAFLWKVVVPMNKPTIVTVSVLTAIGSWNAFLWPLLVSNTQSSRTLTLGLYNFITEGGVRYERLMAASTLVIVPMVVIFLLLRRQIINGVSTQGLKQ